MKDQKIKLSHDKDIGILMFLWHWKLATTAMLGLRFYGSDQSTGIYQRLTRLERAGFIQARTDVSGKRFAWSLTSKGYSAIKARLPALKEDGFKSERLGHDLLVNVVHLGDWVKGVPDGFAVFTEQQLRRYSESSYPDWIPPTDRHRPDGYWKISSGEKPQVIALEVEISRKTDANYQTIAEFYQAWKRIFKVVWVVDQVRDAERLYKKLSNGPDSALDFHNFLTVGQVIEHGWRAKFVLGSDSGKALAEMLHYQPMTSQSPVIGKSLMNTSKSPYKTAGYITFEPADFCY